MASVLIVDDEPSVRLFYSDVLAEEGYDVIEAGSGLEALRMIHRHPLDLVVLDIKLGSENGLELLQRIVTENPGLPVVLLSAYVSFQDDYTTWLADSYVLKSGDPSEFCTEIHRALRPDEKREASEQTIRPKWETTTRPYQVGVGSRL